MARPIQDWPEIVADQDETIDELRGHNEALKHALHEIAKTDPEIDMIPLKEAFSILRRQAKIAREALGL